jgi:hypothetical protein
MSRFFVSLGWIVVLALIGLVSSNGATAHIDAVGARDSSVLE